MAVLDSQKALFVGNTFARLPFSNTSTLKHKCTTRRLLTTGKRCLVIRAVAPGAGGIEEPRLRPVGADGCSTGELKRISNSVAVWLDGEYPEDSLRVPHRVLGDAAAAHYAKVRQEGTDELGAILVALGGRLEQDVHLFHELFVGPWEVANKMSDLVLDLPVAVPPVHSDDSFGKYNFLQRILDGEVDAAEINGAVAITAGFRPLAGSWGAADVRDKHFMRFADRPPDVLADDQGEWNDTLKYMEVELGIEDEGKKEEFHTFIEALHGVEISRIRRNDTEDKYSSLWRKWEIICMWLHIKGDY